MNTVNKYGTGRSLSDMFQHGYSDTSRTASVATAGSPAKIRSGYLPRR